jgi:aldose 1-epimerase
MKKVKHNCKDGVKANQYSLILTALLLVLILSVGCNQTEEQNNQMDISEEIFGQLNDGREVHLYTLRNEHGMQAKITNYGGIITSLKVAGRNGEPENIVLGFDNLDDYLSGHPYFGALIGRYGNRIANGRFSIDGEEYQLARNDGNNHLHGGEMGFDKVLWDAEITDDGSLLLSYRSEDGEEGYPGDLDVTVTYSLTGDNELVIDYHAETDKATHINLTAHSYFNLSGDFSSEILGHELKLHAEHYTPVDEELIPTGDIAAVENTPFDFTGFHRIGSRIDQVEGGYDHNFVLDNSSGELALAAELVHPESGRKLSLYTSEPGLQFYAGNFLDGSLSAPDGTPYGQYSGMCLEPQHFPNSPNEPEFPSTILRPGEIYQSQTIYSFSVEP